MPEDNLDPEPPAEAHPMLAAFAGVCAKRFDAETRKAIGAILAGITVREGFGRGANYTRHSSIDKHANASACIEPLPAGGFDLILSPMSGARAIDAVGRLADHVKVALYPAIRREGKSKADARGKERRAFVDALRLTKANGSWGTTDPAWSVLDAPGIMPETRYAGSAEPKNAREMLAFFLTGPNSDRKCYFSLRKDGADGDTEMIRSLYVAGFISRPVKATVPVCYAPPAPVAAPETLSPDLAAAAEAAADAIVEQHKGKGKAKAA